MNGLMMHTGGKHATREQIAALPPPESLGRFHKPMPHIEVIEAITTGVKHLGFETLDEDFGLSKDGGRLFGVLRFKNGESEARMLGFRNSTDESMALSGVCGKSIFICDNMAFTGEMFVFNKKNTTNASVEQVVAEGMAKVLDQFRVFEQFQQQLEQFKLLSTEASDWLCRLAMAEVVPDRVVMQGMRNYFTPEGKPDCEPRSAWGLHNALTRTLVDGSLRVKMEQGIAISRFFDDRLGEASMD